MRQLSLGDVLIAWVVDALDIRLFLGTFGCPATASGLRMPITGCELLGVGLVPALIGMPKLIRDCDREADAGRRRRAVRTSSSQFVRLALV
jgi:hypothetical protein